MLFRFYVGCTLALIFQRFEATAAVTMSLKSVPDFMLRLFRSTANDDGTIKDNVQAYSHLVRSYLSSGTIGKDTLLFNLTGNPATEPVWKATINLYKKLPSMTHTSPRREHATVTIVDVATGKTVSSQNVPIRGQRWLVMDITSLVIRWLQQPHTNQGVQVRTGTKKGKLKGLMESLLLEYDSQNTTFGPLLVLYANESDNVIRTMAARSIPKTASRQFRSTRNCSRHDMIVKFSTMKWYDVLIPIEFNAYRCDGGCVFPLGASSNPTNHAQIQSLLSLQGNIASPCCVPTKLGSLSVMYLDRNKSLCVRSLSAMIVKQCSCK